MMLGLVLVLLLSGINHILKAIRTLSLYPWTSCCSTVIVQSRPGISLHLPQHCIGRGLILGTNAAIFDGIGQESGCEEFTQSSSPSNRGEIHASL
jgi:hypothetical protein